MPSEMHQQKRDDFLRPQKPLLPTVAHFDQGLVVLAADHVRRPLSHIALYERVRERVPDETLWSEYGVCRIRVGLLLRGLAQQHTRVREGDAGWGRQALPFVGNHDHVPSPPDRHSGVAGAEVDAHFRGSAAPLRDVLGAHGEAHRLSLLWRQTQQWPLPRADRISGGQPPM